MLAAPEGLCVLSTINGFCLLVGWGIVPGASWDNVYRSPIPHDSFISVAAGVPGLTYYDNPYSPPNLNLGNDWYYSVSTVDSTGEGPLSPPSTFQPYGALVQTNVPRPGLSLWSLM